jgi:flagellar hook-basal body complex protein FliE
MFAMNSITSINPSLPLAPSSSVAGLETGRVEKPFKEFLTQALNEVNTMQADADQAVKQLITGGDVNPAEVLTAVQKADMSFRLMMQIRNKLVDAYKEINAIRV